MATKELLQALNAGMSDKNTLAFAEDSNMK